MKKSMRILAALVMMVVVISSMSVTVFARRYLHDNVADSVPDNVHEYVDLIVVTQRERRDLASLVTTDLSDKDVTWVSTDDNIATVNSKGVVKGWTKGTCYVIASYRDGDQNVKEIFYISVVNNLQEDYCVINLNVGDKINLGELFLPAISPRTMTNIKSNIPYIVVVNKDAGTVTATDIGKRTITVSYEDENGDKFSYPVIVNVVE